MAESLLSAARSPRRLAERGFTLIEIMITLAVTITVMLANLYLFNVANMNYARARALRTATDIATKKIADFRGMTIDDIVDSAPNADPTPNPLNVARGAEASYIYGPDDYHESLPFTVSWTISAVDLEHTGTASSDLGELRKIVVDVSWQQYGQAHRVSMPTFVIGSE